MSLQALTAELEAFADGRLSLAELRRWFTPYLVAVAPEREEAEEIPWSPERDDETLFWQLIWLVEDETLGEARHRDVARRVLRCLSDTGRSENTLDLLPLITGRPRLCDVIRKHRRGIVSRAGLLSVVSKRFRFEPDLRAWLAAASLESLEVLCGFLAEDDYSAALRLLSRPPA